MKAVLSPELLRALQDVSNRDKVRHVLTATSKAHSTSSVDITVNGETRKLSLSPVIQPAPELTTQG